MISYLEKKRKKACYASITQGLEVNTKSHPA